MRKWVFWAVLLLLLTADAVWSGTGIVGGRGGLRNADLPMESSSRNNELLAITPDQVYRGNLLLVNREYAVHAEGVAPDIIKLSEHPELREGYGLMDQSIRLSKEVAERFGEMVKAAAGDGVSQFLISSGYRSKKEQEQLFEQKGSDYALPAGNSEHNIGFSLDIGSAGQEMSRAPEGRWLREHAAEYGFILRYPEDKTEITGIEYEPWHFRYVGLPHSLIMQEQHWTLEEYLDVLKERQSYSATVGGQTYTITYHAVSGNTVIPVPADRGYELSGDNRDGVILTELPSLTE